MLTTIGSLFRGRSTAQKIQVATPSDVSRTLEHVHPECVREIHATFEGTIRALGQALELRDFETHGHTDRVVRWSGQMLDCLNVDEATVRAVKWGAYLHDIGKLAVPDTILLKPGKLTDTEWQIMKAHPVNGLKMLRGIPSLPKETLAVVACHHERWDGQGYPKGLATKHIPFSARLFSVVDVFDALTSTRPYKQAWSIDAARQYLETESGKQFDPGFVKLFLSLPLASTEVASDNSSYVKPCTEKV